MLKPVLFVPRRLAPTRKDRRMVETIARRADGALRPAFELSGPRTGGLVGGGTAAGSVRRGRGGSGASGCATASVGRNAVGTIGDASNPHNAGSRWTVTTDQAIGGIRVMLGAGNLDDMWVNIFQETGSLKLAGKLRDHSAEPFTADVWTSVNDVLLDDCLLLSSSEVYRICQMRGSLTAVSRTQRFTNTLSDNSPFVQGLRVYGATNDDEDSYPPLSTGTTYYWASAPLF
jgi:hypothetical protein